MAGPRWALWLLRAVWLWFAVGAALMAVTRGLPLLTGALAGDPEAVGGLLALILIVGVLAWARPRLFTRAPS